jgi:hypothetical protein
MRPGGPRTAGYTACRAVARMGGDTATTEATAPRMARAALSSELHSGCVESAATVAICRAPDTAWDMEMVFGAGGPLTG